MHWEDLEELLAIREKVWLNERDALQEGGWRRNVLTKHWRITERVARLLEEEPTFAYTHIQLDQVIWF